MTESVNPKYVSLCSGGFSFLINPNGPKKDIYIVIFFNMLEFTVKGIFSANLVCAAGHF